MTCSPGSMPLRISALPSAFSPTVTEPGLDDAVAHHLDDGAVRAVEHGRERHQGAVAAVDLDGAAREGADGEAGDGIDRQADAAEPGGAVHFRRDQPHAGGHRLIHAGRADQGRLTDAETGQRDFRHVGFDFDGAAADDAEQRFGGGGHQGAQLGFAPADRAGGRSLDLGPGEADLDFAALSLRQFLVGLGEAEGVFGHRDAGAGDQARRFPLFQRFGGGVAALLQAAGAGEGGVGLAGSSPPLRRSGSSALGDGGERSGERGRVLGELGIQHVAGQAGEHLTAGRPCRLPRPAVR